MFFALLLKKFTDRISWANFSGVVFATSCTEWYFLKRSVVTLFTSTSVVWADRIVATSNSNGVENRSTVWGVPGYSFFSLFMISAIFFGVFMTN